MTETSVATFRTLITGWLRAPRRTVLGMLRACGTERHQAAFHRLFASARWSIDQAGLAVLDLITVGRESVFLAVDDTLLPRCGLKIFGTGRPRDPVLSSRSHVVTRGGALSHRLRWAAQRWVVLCVVIESRHVPGRHFALPVLARLYLNTSAAEKWRRTYRTKNELMRQMLSLLNEHVADTGQPLHLLGDSARCRWLAAGSTAPAVLGQLPSSVAVTGRVVANVRIHEPPPQRRTGQVGRPRKRGERLPTPQEMLQATGLRRLTVKRSAGATDHVHVATQVGRPPRRTPAKASDRDVLVIAVEPLRGGRGIEVFYTTDTGADVETVLRRYLWRWTIEVTFPDTKTHRGITEPQNRPPWPPAAPRTAATGFLLDSLIVWWHETTRRRPARPLRLWHGKRGASFADMLAALRLQTLQNTRQTYFSTPAIPPGIKKFIGQLTRLVSLAA